MSVYTVHEPPSRAGATASAVERFAFVRDGFSWWAFLFAPLWMLRHRMWLVLIGYVVVSVGLGTLVKLSGASALIVSLIGLLIALLVGLEAGTLRRFTLNRRGWKNLGVVSGVDLEDAERRFFDAWLRRTNSPSSAPHAPMPRPASAAPVRRGPPGSDVIGLFPEPGAPR
jgi:Protein of unknown function (DUF2628)